MCEQGYVIRQEADYVIYDNWNFQLVDEQGTVLDWDGLYDTDPFPNYDQSYSGGNCQVRIMDEFDKPCIQMPFTEYSFLLAYGEKTDPALKASKTDWEFEDTIVRTGTTNGLILLHYPEYIAFLKEKGWTETLARQPSNRRWSRFGTRGSRWLLSWRCHSGNRFAA